MPPWSQSGTRHLQRAPRGGPPGGSSTSTRHSCLGPERSFQYPTSAGVRANLEDNRRIAIGFSRPADHRTIQIKGAVTRLHLADDRDRECIDRYRVNLDESWSMVGVPSRFTERAAHWPAWSAFVRVEGIFLQTPGPGAGAPLGQESPK